MWAECFPGRKDELANDFEIHYISHIKKRNERKKKKKKNLHDIDRNWNDMSSSLAQYIGGGHKDPLVNEYVKDFF